MSIIYIRHISLIYNSINIINCGLYNPFDNIINNNNNILKWKTLKTGLVINSGYFNNKLQNMYHTIKVTWIVTLNWSMFRVICIQSIDSIHNKCSIYILHRLLYTQCIHYKIYHTLYDVQSDKIFGKSNFTKYIFQSYI